MSVPASSGGAPAVSSAVSSAAQSLILFANSRRIGARADLLADPATAARALARAGLGDAAVVPAPAVLRRLVGLRAALNAILDGDDAAWAVVNREAARLRLHLVFEAGPATVLSGPADPVTAVLLLLRRAVDDGSWQRIRLCANEVCAVAFYDGTRSRTQRWHSYARCGNRANVAAHRARHSPDS